MSVIADPIQLDAGENNVDNGNLAADPEAKCLLKGVTVSRYLS